MRAPLNRLLILLAATGVLLACAALAGAHPMDATDIDHDNYKNWADNCPKNYNPKQTDTDADTPPPVANAGTPPDPIGQQTGPVQVYPQPPVDTQGNETPADPDPEKGGDACDVDDDGDLVYDKKSPGKKGPDNCRLKPNPQQEDNESDGVGDVCDPDDDNDDALDDKDNCPVVANPDQKDHDNDGKGNACDPDAPTGSASSLSSGGNANDKTAPKLTVKVARAQRYEEIQRGVTVGVRCSEGCILEGVLMLDGRTARALKVARKAAKTVVVGRGAAQLEDRGLTFVFVKLKASTMRRLSRAPALAPLLRITAKDARGNRRVTSKRLKLRR